MVYFGQKWIDKAIEIGDLEEEANARFNMGMVRFFTKEFDQTIYQADEAINIFDNLITARPNEVVLKLRFAVAMRSAFQGYRMIGENEKSLAALYKARTLLERSLEQEPNNSSVKRILAEVLWDIGLTNRHWGDKAKAIIFYTQAAELIKEQSKIHEFKTSSSIDLWDIYDDISETYSSLGNEVKADKYRELTNQIFELNREAIYNTFDSGQRAKYFMDQNNVDSALFYSRAFLVEIENKPDHIAAQVGKANSLLAKAYYIKGDLKTAVSYGEVAIDNYLKASRKNKAWEIAGKTAEAYGILGNFKKGFEYQNLYMKLAEELRLDENSGILASSENQYLQVQKAKIDSLIHEQEQMAHHEEVRVGHLETESQKKIGLIYLGGFGVTLILGFIVFNRFRKTKKQKTIIELQKHEVEAKANEILDSISYAKRIQKAILPPDKLIKKNLPNSFVLYKPKDIVAGDFYWLETIGNKVLFAAADCTGHGVPGAMVSVICNNSLNRSVREFGLKKPGEILDKTRELVIQEFEKSEEEVKDGMDIALCALEETNLLYAGANNALWIIRSGEVLETKADKMPIGKYAELNPFTTHEIELQKGDSIYIFSDGYVDQFGGEKGKKLKAKNFKALLLSIQGLSMEEQKPYLDKAFEDWRGPLEQIDDVCIIGISI